MTAWMENLAYFTQTLLFIAFLCMGYELSQPAARKGQGMAPSTGPQGDAWTGIPNWQRDASQKAVERYAMAQERKWRRWNEAMFERK